MSVEQLAARLDTAADELRQAAAGLDRLQEPRQPAPGRLADTADRTAAGLAAALDDRRAEARQLTDALAQHAVAVRRAVAELAALDPQLRADQRSLEG
jgi:hypothetical protein